MGMHLVMHLFLVLLTLVPACAGASAKHMHEGRSHDKPTQAEGPLFASAPQLILLGLPKAGTTSVFSCLTSGAFHNPAPCCADEKEPQFFRYNLGKLKELQLKNGTYTRRPGVLLLDFSTIYMAEAAWSIPRLSMVYASAAAKRELRFVLFLRDPTARALSNFCMFQPTLSTTVSRLAFRDMNDQRPSWWSSLSGLLQQANVTEEELVTAFPQQLMGRDGGLNRTALAFVAKDEHFVGRARLRRMLLPWTEVCASDSGWGWNLDAKSFEQSVLNEIRWARDPATGCGQPPSAAATMTTPVLRDYVRRCHSTRNFMSTANLSVPAFQLALFLRTFPDSHYAFFKYEQLFESGLSEEEVRQLLARGLGLEQQPLALKSHKRKESGKCDFSESSVRGLRGKNGTKTNLLSFKHISAQHHSMFRVRALLDPWYDEMLRLAFEFQTRRGLCCLPDVR